METSEARLSCPKCDNEVAIARTWTRGGVKDSGGYVLECSKCKHKFAVHLGRDFNPYASIRGATVLDTYDGDVEGDREKVLGSYGLQS
jgi:hypothetical protein